MQGKDLTCVYLFLSLFEHINHVVIVLLLYYMFKIKHISQLIHLVFDAIYSSNFPVLNFTYLVAHVVPVE